MKSERLKNDLVIILITSFILIVCWIGFNIYNKSVSSTIDETLAKEIQPIPPNFDTETIDALNKRERIAPLFSLTQTEEASESAPTPTPEIVIPIPADLLEDESDIPSEDVELFNAIPDASEEADLAL